jgi:uncharacterized protein YjiS (DUF1127 family)
VVKLRTPRGCPPSAPTASLCLRLAMEGRLTVTISTIGSGAPGESGRRLSCWITRVMTYWARRETIKMLRELDDHQLRDIGLPRHQIESTVKRRRDCGV